MLLLWHKNQYTTDGSLLMPDTSFIVFNINKPEAFITTVTFCIQPEKDVFYQPSARNAALQRAFAIGANV